MIINDDLQSTSTEDRGRDEEKLVQLYKLVSSEPKILLQAPRDDIHASYGEAQQETRPFNGEAAIDFSHGTDPTGGSRKLTKLEDSRSLLKLKDTHRSLPHPSLNISLGSPGVSSHIALSFSGGVGEGSQTVGPSSLQQGPRSCPILPKFPKSGVAGPETIRIPPVRVARPPAEGRGKNQLLPRYWPRITDQELQQLSGVYP